MAIDATSIETRNVIVIVLTMPSKAVCHVKYLNVGLFFEQEFSLTIASLSYSL